MRAEYLSRILGSISVKEHRIWLQKKLQGEAPVEGGQVDRVVGLEGVRAEIASGNRHRSLRS